MRKILTIVFGLLFLASVSVTAINLAELETHKSSDSCWISLKGDVYDVTAFLPKHPGGRQILFRKEFWVEKVFLAHA